MTGTQGEATWGEFRLHGWKARWLAFCQGVRGRRLAVWARKPLKSVLRGWVDTEVWGLKLRLASRGNLSEQRLLLTPGSLDVTEREALAGEVRDGEVFLDIGANAGVYTLWMASRRGGSVRVEAFEPDPELCRRLGENLARNKLENVTLHRFALGDRDGEAALQRGGENLGENEVRTDGGDGVTVPLRRLPGVLAEAGIDSVAALKIDVEGHEAEVLKPYLAEVEKSRWPRLVVCEVPPRVSDVGDLEVGRLLMEHGYEPAGRGRMNGLFRRRS